MFTGETHCCGLGDFQGLQDRPGITAFEVIKDATENHGHEAFLTFCVAKTQFGHQAHLPNSKLGKEVAAMIRKEKLGSITTLKPRVNTNSNNLLQVWLWGIDRPACREFVEASKTKANKGA